MRLRHSHLALLHDTIMAAIAFAAAVYIRRGPAMLADLDAYVLPGAIFAGVSALVFAGTGLHRGIWRYASFDDVLVILRAAALATLGATLAMFLLSRGFLVPRSSMVLSFFLLTALLAVPRLAYRASKDRQLGHIFRRGETARRVPVLLIGAGDQADQFIREMARGGDGAYRVVGIVDHRARRVGQAIRGVPVLGTIEEIAEVVAGLKRRDAAPQRMVLARDDLDSQRIERLLELSESLALPLATLPRLTDFRDGAQATLDVKPVAIEDLLNRPQTALDLAAIADLARGRRILVTGAGGTIGGELSRQLAGLGPARLALLDHSEYALYTIDLELSELSPTVARRAILCDVRDRVALGAVFAEERPELVFHAAALKHLPMVELNPLEGILTNVIGTRNVAELARDHAAAAMVMISTDKAVNPTNVMGATKRLAEAWCQAVDVTERRRGAGSTRFVTVRFGNVLGSTGSVVPLFQRQLAAGGPLTVTHPEISRYFMTVREAVELVLQASALGMAEDGAAGGGIFVLDMGEPVRIVDLARRVIRLAGRRPDIDVAISFTGLRPGEKLHEELFHDAEALMPTRAEGILLAAPRTADQAVLARALDELEALARSGRAGAALDLLARLIPEFSTADADRRAASPRGRGP